MDIDEHEGQRVSRRRMIAGVTSVGMGALVAMASRPASATVLGGTTSTPSPTGDGRLSPQDAEKYLSQGASCTLTPTTTKGPYYFDVDKVRSDIREDRVGAQFQVILRVQDSEVCGPVENAVVEIWHVDAAGKYSGAEGQMGAAAPPPAGEDFPDWVPKTTTQYLRGAQVTDRFGIVQFTTIYPGWYAGRAPHIHVMVHIDNTRTLITELMFDDALSDSVYLTSPYDQHTGRTVFNDTDTHYQDYMLTNVVQRGPLLIGAHTLVADSDHDGA